MAWSPFSDEARTLLTGPHTPVRRVEVWHGGRPVYTLDATGGSVSVDVDRPVRRNLSATLRDPTGELSKGDVTDLLNPYDAEVAVFRGVRTSLGDELAPQGVFSLTSRKVADTPEGLAVSLTGQDRALAYQGGMRSALAISAGTPVEVAISRLLAARQPGATLRAINTGFTCGPLLFKPDINVWKEATDLATSVGAALFHDRTGAPTLTGYGPTATTPVASYMEGDGLLLSVERTEDSDTVANVVVAESENGTIRVEVSDENPESPTYVGGRYGPRVADPLVSPYFGSIQQAQQAAAARLAYELGRAETVAFAIVPDPSRDETDNVTLHRPRIGLDHRAFSISTLEVPLDTKSEMPVGCRRNVLTQDGQVLPVQEVSP